MKNFVVMLAAILTLCGTPMLLTSCSIEDNPTTNVDELALAQKLSGRSFYSIYEASGTAKDESDNSIEAAYNIVIDVYDFQEDGTGSFQRFFFDYENIEPVMTHGLVGYGVFSYSSTADGTINISLSNNWDQSYPQQWTVQYADETITAKGVDGQTLTLERADEETQAALNNLAEQNGDGGDKFDVADYKPIGVDNSQWMKTLDDSRLVADLSLPGSHDACTAEGWQEKLLSVIAEMTAKTQDLTISEQLKVGMRVFDLRPEHVLETGGSRVLRCSHGMMSTKMLVRDFFQQLKEFLAANPSEFCILTVDLSATSNKEAWGKAFTELVSSDEFRSMFADFKPRLTVGEMRCHVLMLSRQEYAQQPIGGYCYGWVYDIELEKQTKGHITGADGVETPLWVQDYWGENKRDGKDEAVLRMLEAAAARTMDAEKPAWVINYPSAYFLLPLSDSYRENAVEANKVTADWLSSHTGSVGIIYMDFAGMEKSPSFSAVKLYDTYGMTLVDMVIKQNFK